MQRYLQASSYPALTLQYLYAGYNYKVRMENHFCKSGHIYCKLGCVHTNI